MEAHSRRSDWGNRLRCFSGRSIFLVCVVILDKFFCCESKRRSTGAGASYLFNEYLKSEPTSAAASGAKQHLNGCQPGGTSGKPNGAGDGSAEKQSCRRRSTKQLHFV